MRRDIDPPRLVKLLLPVDLVRQMDAAILRSQGAYQDRNEFVAEAIRDRLVEDVAAGTDEPAPPPVIRATPASPARVESEPEKAPARVPETPGIQAYVEPALDASAELGEWRGDRPATATATPTKAVSFGLHNRDLPTLWALDRLAVAATSSSPVMWEGYLRRVRNEGAHLGSLLRGRDLTNPIGLRAGIGFPKPGVKGEASIDRFIASAIGSPKRADGPFFVLALAAPTDDGRGLLPTDVGLAVLGDMIERGLRPSLPQPPAAFECWWRYLRSLAPAEHAAWLKVLRVVSGGPRRDELTQEFPEWRGHTATTNTVGFISRSREWGLVEPELIDQRYRLTELGRAATGEG